MNGRYIRVDSGAAGVPTIGGGDGSHTHGGGAHSHPVTGLTAPLPATTRRGDSRKVAVGRNQQVPITGTALPENSEHTHSGGAHEHQYVGLRLCKVVSSPSGMAQ
jgi:hypothetical protein